MARENDRRIFLVLCAVALVVIGYIGFQIVTDPEKREEKEPPVPRREEGTAQDLGDIHDEPQKPEPSPADPAAIDVAKLYVAEYLRRDRKADDWYAKLEPYCEVLMCQRLKDHGPSYVREMTITGEPVVTESTNHYLVVQFPTDQTPQVLQIVLGTDGTTWKVYETGIY